jgi:hypothetical protein
MAEVLLAVGVVLTALHVLLDLRQFMVHIKHPRDWFTLISAVCLIGHVVLTGELAAWKEALLG